MRLALALLIATTSFAAPREEAGPGEGPDPFVCCDNPRVRAVVERYVDLVETLAARESETQVTGKAYALRNTLKPDPALDAHENRIIEALEQQVSGVRNSAEDIAAALPSIGRGVLFLALRHEGAAGLTVVEAWCPDRGPWLQRSTAAPKSPWGGSCARWR